MILPLQYFLPLDILLGISAFLVSKHILNKREVVKEREVTENEEIEILNTEIDETEKKILDAIRNGAKTLNQVMKATGLPKATAYRKIKSLIKKGIVSVKIENNKRMLVVNEKENKEKRRD